MKNIGAHVGYTVLEGPLHGVHDSVRGARCYLPDINF
jgi:hypothetical protein